MNTYDFTAAEDFLKNEVGATPQQIKEEIGRVIDELERSRVFTMRNTRILGLLSVFSDLVGRIIPQSPEK